jgi:hypothetical protein
MIKYFDIYMQNFINAINIEYNVDVINNINYDGNDIILNNDENFNFFLIFVLDLGKSGLCNVDKFISIGTSEDNNMHVREKYYKYISQYYAVYNEMYDCIILKKNIIK